LKWRYKRETRGEGDREERIKRKRRNCIHKKKLKQKKKKNAARGIPRWSPTPVLTTPEGA
jgi:hypothetical protein